ncbi:MAG: CHASE3 domain-containing protein [Methylophilaceae bacterium]
MKIGAGYMLALAILLVFGVVCYQSAIQFSESAAARKHSFEVLCQLEATLSDVKDAETGQRGYLLTGNDHYLEPFQAAQASIKQRTKTLSDLTKDNINQKHRIDTLQPLIDSKFAEIQETVAIRGEAKGFDAALKIVRSDNGQQIMDGIRQTIGDMASEESVLLKQSSDQVEASARNIKFIIIFGTIAAFIVLILTSFIITRNIARPLQDLTIVAERIASCDLSVNMAANTRSDEVGVLARTFAHMTENLREHIRGLVEGANVLGSAASEIVASTVQLSTSASESAAAVSETTTTVEEVRQTVQVASQKAGLVSESSQKAAQSSQSGRKSIEDASAGMARIRQQMDAIAVSMGRLSEQSQAIGQIMASVEDLAAQSKLLAVNAAIEAAKAGEHGKGFGVVAQEVRSLAEQSRQATNQVRTILGDIQKATTTAVMATEQGSKAVEAGTWQTEVAGAAIKALDGSVTSSTQAAMQIAASSQQQLVGIDQVASAMDSIKQASVQNVESARQLESAAGNLNELGQRLKQMVERYKV